MKSYPIQVPFYTLLPAIWIDDGNLYIKTSKFLQFMGIFSYCRMIHIDRYRRIVEIKMKKWWQWESPSRIPFDKIDYIDLTYPECPRHEKDFPSKIYDLFIITKDPFRRIDLFRFGGSEASSPVYQETAVSCAELMAKHIGTEFGLRHPKNLPLADFKDKYICSACGHQLHPDTEFLLCPYCGGKEIRIE